jgi:hypothetical protein
MKSQELIVQSVTCKCGKSFVLLQKIDNSSYPLMSFNCYIKIVKDNGKYYCVDCDTITNILTEKTFNEYLKDNPCNH